MDQVQPWHSYCGPAPLPSDLIARWNLDPILLITLAAALAAYVVIFRSNPRAVERPYAMPLAIGLAFVLFVSPFCALTAALFSVRALHHLALVALIAPLIVAAFKRVKVSLIAVYLAPLLHAAVYWAWHAPAAYEAALSSNVVYWAMQTTLLASAILLWLAIRAAPAPAGIALALITMVQMGLLGALLTFAPIPLYAPHFATTEPWGLATLADQQLAGAFMWVVGGGVYLVVALRLAMSFLAKRPAPA